MASGVGAGGLPADRQAGARAQSPPFPPLEVATVKALACELPARRDAPLRRSSTAEIARLVGARPEAAGMRHSTVWRILDRAAPKPWRHRSWITVRDPDFAAKAGRVLDLYEGVWDGQPLAPEDCVLSADEQTSLQARARRHPTTPPGPHQPVRVKHEYRRGGALADLAARDIRRGGAIGHCEAATGLAPFGRLVEQVMAQSRTARPRAPSGSSTTAAAIAATQRPGACRNATRISSWSICRPTPPSSTRASAPSRSSSARR